MQTRVPNERFQIGDLATELGINTKTIRYYEQIGLLPPPARTQAGYRLYCEKERDQLRFIIKAKATGLTLEEIGEVLTLRRNGHMPCEQVLTILDRKLSQVDQQVQALLDFRDELLTLRADAAGTMDGESCICGIIEQHQPLHQATAPPLLRVHEVAVPTS